MLNFDVQNILSLHVLKFLLDFLCGLKLESIIQYSLFPIPWPPLLYDYNKQNQQYCAQIWVVTRECGFILQVLRQVDENLKQFNANYMILKDYLSEVQHKLKSLCQQVTQVILILPVHDCIDLSPWLRHCK